MAVCRPKFQVNIELWKQFIKEYENISKIDCSKYSSTDGWLNSLFALKIKIKGAILNNLINLPETLTSNNRVTGRLQQYNNTESNQNLLNMVTIPEIETNYFLHQSRPLFSTVD